MRVRAVRAAVQRRAGAGSSVQGKGMRCARASGGSSRTVQRGAAGACVAARWKGAAQQAGAAAAVCMGKRGRQEVPPITAMRRGAAAMRATVARGICGTRARKDERQTRMEARYARSARADRA